MTNVFFTCDYDPSKMMSAGASLGKLINENAANKIFDWAGLKDSKIKDIAKSMVSGMEIAGGLTGIAVGGIVVAAPELFGAAIAPIGNALI